MASFCGQRTDDHTDAVMCLVLWCVVQSGLGLSTPSTETRISAAYTSRVAISPHWMRSSQLSDFVSHRRSICILLTVSSGYLIALWPIQWIVDLLDRMVCIASSVRLMSWQLCVQIKFYTNLRLTDFLSVSEDLSLYSLFAVIKKNVHVNNIKQAYQLKMRYACLWEYCKVKHVLIHAC